MTCMKCCMKVDIDLVCGVFSDECSAARCGRGMCHARATQRSHRERCHCKSSNHDGDVV